MIKNPLIPDIFYSGAVQTFSWCLHLVYSYQLRHRISLSVRGPQPVIFAWFLCLLVNIIQCRSIISQSDHLVGNSDKVTFASAIISCICQGVYLLTLIPAGDQRSSQYEELGSRDRPDTEPLLSELGFSTSFRQRALYAGNYGGFLDEHDPYYLGVAKDSSKVGWLNKLLFFWVNPLIAKGVRGNLNTADDVHDLPEYMTVHQISLTFKQKWDYAERLNPGSVKLLKILYSCYGKTFFAIGSLKFITDVSGFAGPILLNLLVTFVEDKKKEIPIGYGYLYAILLSGTAFISAISSCHFNFFMSELGLRIRGAVSSSVYRKVINVSKSKLSKFNNGQIINFMSTDVDRIVNFCPSLHAAWSLPFQFIVTLILLHQQVGISFLTGLIFTILVIPVNKWIANKIGNLSEKMMTAKDSRVNLMSELLSGIRVIKCFNWQKFFSGKVNEKRGDELKYLKGRKYLDALCVFLWASTPVIISVLTFITYVLLGNTLTAAKVFTSVALFAMLTGKKDFLTFIIRT